MGTLTFSTTKISHSPKKPVSLHFRVKVNLVTDHILLTALGAREEHIFSQELILAVRKDKIYLPYICSPPFCYS